MASRQRVGYIRVSSLGQNPERQLDSVVVDRVFTDGAVNFVIWVAGMIDGALLG